MRALIGAFTLSLVLLAGCATTESTETAAPAAAPSMAKTTCATDTDCGAGRMCVKPEAADYGFCL